VRQRSGQQIVVPVLVGSGLAGIAAGAVLAFVVDPLLALIALAGVLDLGLAWAFGTGRLGAYTGGGSESLEREASVEPSADPAEDPSYNPYARED